MEFDIALQIRAAQPNPGVTEVGPPEQIPATGMQDLQRPAVFRHRMRRVEFPSQPDLLHEPFGDGERAIEPLDLRYRQVLRGLIESSSWLPCSGPQQYVDQ